MSAGFPHTSYLDVAPAKEPGKKRLMLPAVFSHRQWQSPLFDMDSHIDVEICSQSQVMATYGCTCQIG